MTRQELEEWADKLPVGYLTCRSRNHNMILKDTWPVGRGGFGQLSRCSNCRTTLTEILNAAGFVVDRKLEYVKGYLAPKGAGRRTKERNGMMRLRRARRFIESKQP